MLCLASPRPYHCSYGSTARLKIQINYICRTESSILDLPLSQSAYTTHNWIAHKGIVSICLAIKMQF